MVNTGNEYMANISLICYYRARYFYVFHILQVFFRVMEVNLKRLTKNTYKEIMTENTLTLI